VDEWQRFVLKTGAARVNKKCRRPEFLLQIMFHD